MSCSDVYLLIQLPCHVQKYLVFTVNVMLYIFCNYLFYRLVCVGGDGMFSEVLNGLMTRTSQENNIQQSGNFEPVPSNIRIGIIPAGNYL